MNKNLRFALLFISIVSLVVPSQVAFVGAQDPTTSPTQPPYTPPPTTPPYTPPPSPTPTVQQEPSPTPTQTAQATTSPTGTPLSGSPTADTHGCVSPSYWDGSKCATAPASGSQQCNTGSHWDYQQNRCVQDMVSGSPYPTTPSTGGSQTCNTGNHWDSQQNRCVPDFGGGQSCPPGQHWGEYSGNCIQDSQNVGCAENEYFDFNQQKCMKPEMPTCNPDSYFDYKYNKCVLSQRCPEGEHMESSGCVKNQGGQSNCNVPAGCYLVPDPKYGTESCRYDCSSQRPTQCMKTSADLERERKDFEQSCGVGNVRLEQVDPLCKGYVCDFGGEGHFSGGEGGFDYKQYQDGKGPKPGFFQQQSAFSMCEPYDKLKANKDKAEKAEMKCFVENRGGCDQLKCMKGDAAENFENEGTTGPGGCTTFETCDKFCRTNPDVCRKWEQKNLKGEKRPEGGKFKFEVSEDAYKNCAAKGGSVFEKRNNKGELEAFDCVEHPREAAKKRKTIAPTERVPSAIELASIVLQVEELKPPIIELGARTDALAEFHKKQGNEKDVVRFEKASDKFDTAGNNVDTIKDEIKKLIETPAGTAGAVGLTGKQIAEKTTVKRKITESTINKIRKEIKEKVEGPLEDAVFILVGAEKEVEKVVSNEREDVEVKNEEDFKTEMEWRIQNCKPGKVKLDFVPPDIPAEVPKAMRDKIRVQMEGDVKGLADEKCDFTVKGQFPFEEKEKSMKCSLPEDVYAAADIEEAGDDILKNCSGDLVDTMKEGPGEGLGGPGGPGPGQGPPEMVKLARELGGEGSPEELKELCSESAENAKKCLPVLQDFNKQYPGMVPDEAFVGLGCLSGDQAKCAEMGKQFGRGPPGGRGPGGPGGPGNACPARCITTEHASEPARFGENCMIMDDYQCPRGSVCAKCTPLGKGGGNFPGGGATGGNFPGGGDIRREPPGGFQGGYPSGPGGFQQPPPGSFPSGGGGGFPSGPGPGG